MSNASSSSIENPSASRRPRRKPSANVNLRDCQFDAVTELDGSVKKAKPRSLVQMTTGAGKTYAAITFVYRLLKFARAKRVLFLVNTRKPCRMKNLNHGLHGIHRVKASALCMVFTCSTRKLQNTNSSFCELCAFRG